MNDQESDQIFRMESILKGKMKQKEVAEKLGMSTRVPTFLYKTIAIHHL